MRYNAQIVSVGSISSQGEGAASWEDVVKMIHETHEKHEKIKNLCNLCNLWFHLFKLFKKME
jgi:hypothetical protein